MTPKTTIEMGTKYPYDAPDDWDAKSPLPEVDAAHTAARAVLVDLGDRRGIGHELRDLDEDVRKEIVESLADIIRLAMAAA